MRRIIYLLLSVTLLLLLVACSNTNTEMQRETSYNIGMATLESNELDNKLLSDEKEVPESREGERILVAYFSWADNAEQVNMDAVTSASVTVPGNVAQFAAWIAEETGGELFPIQVVEPYTSDWDECLDRANQEKTNGIRPELVKNVENMEEYDVVFLGYPNWWYSCPMAILSFIETHNLSGKQIYLFCSHGSGGLARSVQDITEALPDSNISQNVFDAYEEETADSREQLNEWLNKIIY